MRHVIIGAGLAGVSAAEELRTEGGSDQEIILLGADPDEPYDHPPLSKGYLRGEDDDSAVRLRDSGWYADNGIERRTVRAERISAGKDTVELEGGEEVPFDRCLVATGGVARRLPVAGMDLAGVMTLRTWADGRALRDAAAATPRVVVVGGGFIGVEAAASLRAVGCEVDLLMLEQVVLERALGTGLGTELGRRLVAAGIRVHPGTSVTSFTGGDRLEGVTTDNAGDLPAGLAVLGVGMAPVVDLAEASGLDLDGDLGGVACDVGFRTSRPGVFAAGDMAAVVSTVAGHRVRVEHWAEALNQGKMAARAMLGQTVEYDRVPYFFSDIGPSSIEYVGVGGPIENDVVLQRGDGLVGCHFRGDRLVGAATLDAGDALDAARDLVRAGATEEQARAGLASAS